MSDVKYLDKDGNDLSLDWENPDSKDYEINVLIQMKEDKQTKMKQLTTMFENSRSVLNTGIININNKLYEICNHEWMRENHLYAELHCNICGVWKR